MFFGRIKAFIKKNWREAAYYGGVLLTLAGLAWGAEIYREARNVQMEVPMTVSAEFEENTKDAKDSFYIPAGMSLAAGYSAVPVWNREMGFWQAHTAVDFECEDVLAVCAGRVKTVGESGIWGGFVEVEGEELLVRYCSIAPGDELAVGQEIRAGDLIGKADCSMPGEMHMDRHVHIELLRGTEMLNLMQMLETSD